MESEWVDFRAVKTAVSMEMVLSRYSVQLRRTNKTYLRGKCPLPTHTSKDGQSFGVHTEKNAWSCLSGSCVKARDGKRGGNILDFIAVMENCSIRDAALKLANWFNVHSDGGRASPPNEKQPTASEQLVAEKRRGETEVTDDILGDAENKPLGFALRNIDHSHSYLTVRGITPVTAADFGAGFFSGKGSMQNRVVIPIHNSVGALVAYAGRSIDETEPRYKVPSGFKKSNSSIFTECSHSRKRGERT